MRTWAAVRAALAREFSFSMTIPALLWQIIFFYIPLLFIGSISFLTYVEGARYALTLEHYRDLLTSAHVKIILRSLILSVGTAFTCLVIAYPVAYYLALMVHRGKNALLFLLILPFWTSFVVHVYAWFFILDPQGLLNSLLMWLKVIKEPLVLLNNYGAIFLVMVYCYLPFMIMPLYTTLEKFNTRLIEASLDLGATPRYTFFNITLPLTLSGIKTGFFLVCVPAFGEFVIPALLGGSKHMFVGSLIYHYFLVARDTFKGAAFTCLSCFALLCIMLFLGIISRRIVRLSASLYDGGHS